jgi:hypothetical protein
MPPPRYSAAGDAETPPDDLLPLRAFLVESASRLFGPAQTWQEFMVASPQGFVFGLWSLDALELWGRRGRFDAPLTLIRAPRSERQLSAYDQEELTRHSCLWRRGGGETHFDVHARANPPTFLHFPLACEQILKKRAGRPTRRGEIREVYLTRLGPAEQGLGGKALYRAIWKMLFPKRKDSDPPPPGMSEPTIARALRDIKEGR